eukprot:5261558-Amphidinium_carterae.2
MQPHTMDNIQCYRQHGSLSYVVHVKEDKSEDCGNNACSGQKYLAPLTQPCALLPGLGHNHTHIIILWVFIASRLWSPANKH